MEQLEDEENEEEDIEKVEDLLEYYLQRVSATQNMAEQILAGARDLEESIGVSLSARRFEVIPLERYSTSEDLVQQFALDFHCVHTASLFG